MSFTKVGGLSLAPTTANRPSHELTSALKQENRVPQELLTPNLLTLVMIYRNPAPFLKNDNLPDVQAADVLHGGACLPCVPRSD